jgi:nucleotide-binding universal stress UspA family protein
VTARYVVGYDGSDAARAALGYADGRAFVDDEVLVVYGYGPPADWVGTPNLRGILESRRDLGHAVLAELTRDGRAVELVAEPPADAIAGAARRHDASEIVVGARGYGRLRGPLGSVSRELLHLADRPVVIVPPAAAVA